MRRWALFLVVLATILASGVARADVRAASVIGSGMVLQRQRPVPIWGWAAPGEKVRVEFAGQALETQAGPDGRWRVNLAAMEASDQPATMVIRGNNTLTFTDVLVGEVWLCSGQSNMSIEVRKVINAEQEVAAANDPLIRGFLVSLQQGMDGNYEIKVAGEVKKYPLHPRDACLGAWQVCKPAVAKDWSAVAYFFARRLRQDLKVPVGIIMSSVGATAIEAWISVDGLKAIPAYRERALAFEEAANAFLADPASLPATLEAQKQRMPEKHKAWAAKLDATDPGLLDKWMAPDHSTSDWKDVTLPVTVADNPLGAPVATIWFRKDVSIPQEWVGKELELKVGKIDGVDQVFVNGAAVGRTWFDVDKYWEVSRRYVVPASAVTSTKVTVAMRLAKTAYHLAPLGPAEEMRLAPVNDTSAAPVSLAGVWKHQKSTDLDAGLQPQLAPLLSFPPGHHYGHPGVQYNGMIHPLIPFAIRGAIWYQGEANAPFYIDYRSLLPGLIQSWRKDWGQGDFPFGIVQLADYYGQQTTPVERTGYTNLRESQAMALSVPNTFLATAVGVGEGADIHPKRKQEVGRRLAMSALGNFYGKKDVTWSGPTYKSMKIEGDKIRLTFDFAKGLHAKGEPPVGFAIAGENRAFYFAKAKIEGESVVVWSEKVPRPVAVRYAWATNPVCNVHNDQDLPMFMFKTDNWDLSQIVIVNDDPVVIPAGWVKK